ncbi:hypothetical protein CYMTET_28860, partial [Cymbomonas tetramitiformis]
MAETRPKKPSSIIYMVIIVLAFFVVFCLYTYSQHQAHDSFTPASSTVGTGIPSSAAKVITASEYTQKISIPEIASPPSNGPSRDQLKSASRAAPAAPRKRSPPPVQVRKASPSAKNHERAIDASPPASKSGALNENKQVELENPVVRKELEPVSEDGDDAAPPSKEDVDQAWKEATNRCHGAPFPLVFGDSGRIAAAAKRAYEEYASRNITKTVDSVSAAKKAWREREGLTSATAKQHASKLLGRRLSAARGTSGESRRSLLNVKRGFPFYTKCQKEKVPVSLQGDEALSAACLRDPTTCRDPKRATQVTANLAGIRKAAESVKCCVFSGQCNIKALPKMKASIETGRMLNALPQMRKADVPRTYPTCALIGNGPGMYVPGMGDVVDKHDAVFKFNLYNLGKPPPARLPPVQPRRACSAHFQYQTAACAAW